MKYLYRFMPHWKLCALIGSERGRNLCFNAKKANEWDLIKSGSKSKIVREKNQNYVI